MNTAGCEKTSDGRSGEALTSGRAPHAEPRSTRRRGSGVREPQNCMKKSQDSAGTQDRSGVSL
jgi:hypothetical protein